MALGQDSIEKIEASLRFMKEPFNMDTKEIEELPFNMDTKEIEELHKKLLELDSFPYLSSYYKNNVIFNKTEVSAENLLQGVRLLAKIESMKAKIVVSESFFYGGVMGAILSIISVTITLNSLILGMICGVLLFRFLYSRFSYFAVSSISSEVKYLEDMINFHGINHSTIVTKLKVYQVEIRFTIPGFTWIAFKSNLSNSKQQPYWMNSDMKPISIKHPTPETLENTFRRTNPEDFLKDAIGVPLYYDKKHIIDLFHWKWSPVGWRKSSYWEYSSSINSKEWSRTCLPFSIIRRKLWTIDIIAKVENGLQTNKKVLTLIRNWYYVNDVDDRIFDNINFILSNKLDRSNFIAQKSSEQNKNIKPCLSRAQIVHKALQTTLRIKRARTIFGLLESIYVRHTDTVSTQSKVLEPSFKATPEANIFGQYDSSTTEPGSFKDVLEQCMIVAKNECEQITGYKSNLSQIKEIVQEVENQFRELQKDNNP